MASGRGNQSVDWTGRLLSIVSLVVAIGAGGYIATRDRGEDQTVDPAAELRAEFTSMASDHNAQQATLQKELREAIDRNDKRLTEWNRRLNTATSSFKTDADALLARIQQDELAASNARSTLFKQAIADFRGELANQRSVESPDSIDQGEPTVEVEAAAFAQLTLADTRLRPASGDETLIRLENNSDEDVIIRRLRFKPEADFRAGTMEREQPSGTDQIVTIAYHPTDNMSTNPGYHGLYVRELDEPIRVPVDQSLTMRVVIDDSHHDGWGFVGQLMVEYNSTTPLIIKVARVRFDDLDAADVGDLVNEST